MDQLIKEGERADKVSGSLTLIQNKKGFAYGTDSVLLAAYIKKTNKTAVELGAGNGVVSFLLERNKGMKRIVAVERDESAFGLLCRNAALNGSEIAPLFKDVRDVSQSDIGGEAGVVFANPPYMKSDSGYLNSNPGKKAARHEMFGDISDFCAAASRLLKTGGVFYCVYRPDRLSDLFSALRDNRLEPKRMTSVHPSVSKRSNLVLVEAKKDAGPGLFLTKPLFLMKKDGSYTGDYDKIYSECEFDDTFKRL